MYKFQWNQSLQNCMLTKGIRQTNTNKKVQIYYDECNKTPVPNNQTPRSYPFVLFGQIIKVKKNTPLQWNIEWVGGEVKKAEVVTPTAVIDAEPPFTGK